MRAHVRVGLGLLVFAAASFCAGVSNAASGSDCGKRVVSDWLDDGRLERIYPSRCYESALARIPVDTSSTVRPDIVRARAYARRGRLAPASTAWRARHAADAAYAAWSGALRAGAAADARTSFPNPPASVLRSRLRTAARRYGFRVTQLYVKWPRQQAPYVVVSTSHPRSFARAAPTILRSLDPKRATGDDRTGWAYEGFLFEARDRHGIPFLATFNWWRGPNAGGGQWAADPSLFPFQHG
jgi:hypothetical protein